MITAKAEPSFSALAIRLAERAKVLAEASAAATRLKGRKDPSRWRSAQLLWPLFTKG